MPKAKTNLVIVESPSKAKTIGKYLGSDYEVKACMGHLRDLPKSTMGVDLEHDFTPVYQPVKGKEDIIRDLKASAKKCDQIYLATDPDREGEAISWHLQALLGIPDSQVNRVTFNEITRGVVTRAIQNPRAIDQDLVDAQQARRILDRIVGYQLSPVAVEEGAPRPFGRTGAVGGHQAGGGSRGGNPRLPAPGVLDHRRQPGAAGKARRFHRTLLWRSQEAGSPQ